jgi:hypothetical protein
MGLLYLLRTSVTANNMIQSFSDDTSAVLQVTTTKENEMQPSGVCNDVILQFIGVLCPMEKPGIAVRTVAKLWDGRPRNRAPFTAGADTFISSNTKTRPPLRFWEQWAPGTYYAGQQGPHLHLQSRSRMWSYNSNPSYVFTAWRLIIRYLLISGR